MFTSKGLHPGTSRCNNRFVHHSGCMEADSELVELQSRLRFALEIQQPEGQLATSIGLPERCFWRNIARSSSELEASTRPRKSRGYIERLQFEDGTPLGDAFERIVNMERRTHREHTSCFIPDALELVVGVVMRGTIRDTRRHALQHVG